MTGIVVGVSGEHLEDAGLLWALREAVVRRLGVRAVHAWPGPDLVALSAGVSAPAPWSSTEDEVRDRLDVVVKHAREQVPSDAVDLVAEVTHGSAGAALAALAQDADLVVLTREHASPVSRFLHGSVATAVLERTTATITVVPGNWRPTEFHGRVLVGVDRSASSLRALTWAADEARRRQVPLVPVLVRSMLDGGLTSGRVASDRADLERWTHELEHLGRVEPQVLAGDAGHVLADLGAPDDVLVVARRGAGASSLADRVLGSTALYVARHAACPVVVTGD